MPSARSFFVLLFFPLSHALAQFPDLSNYEPVLIPVVGSYTGINGSQFSAGWDVAGPSEFAYFAGGQIQHFDGFVRFSNAALSPPGRFLYVDRDALPKVWFHGRIISAEPAGIPYVTTMPIVRQRDFVIGTSVLLAVPSGVGRTRLRIYTRSNGPAQFKITFKMTAISLSTDNPGEGEVSLIAVPPADGDPTIPSYAEMDLTNSIRCFVTSAHSGCVDFNYLVFITPEDVNLPYWPLISLTHEGTQQVELFTPQ